MDLANKERLRDGQGADIKISLEEFLLSRGQDLAPSERQGDTGMRAAEEAGRGEQGEIMMELRRQPPVRRTSWVRDDTVRFQAKQSFDGKGGPLGVVAQSVLRARVLEPLVQELALWCLGAILSASLLRPRVFTVRFCLKSDGTS